MSRWLQLYQTDDFSSNAGEILRYKVEIIIRRGIISEAEPGLEKCGYELSCVLRNGVSHQVSITGGGQGGGTNITVHTEDCQAGYIRNLNTTNSEQEDYIQLTVACEGSEVSDS